MSSGHAVLSSPADKREELAARGIGLLDFRRLQDVVAARVVAAVITLVESGDETLPQVAAALAPHTGQAQIVGITGSPGVGWDLKARAGKKKVVLELGGNAAVIVDADADLDDAVERIIFGAFYQSGQSCIGVQRIIITHPEFRPLIEERCREVLERRPVTVRSRDPRLRSQTRGVRFDG